MSSHAAIAIWKTDQGFFVNTTDKGVIHARKTIREKVKELEDMYMTKHQQSHVGSISACVAYMQFQPSVIRMKLEDLVKIIPKKGLHQIRGDNFGFIGVKLDDVDGAIAWDRGVKPALIQE